LDLASPGIDHVEHDAPFATNAELFLVLEAHPELEAGP
jgi:hypothetical protein